MVERTYRTKQETINYFRTLAFEYEKDAVRTKDHEKEIEFRAKADAFEDAAFQIERNMR